MARKVARCLRKNYKKKVKANAKSEQAAVDGANEIAALFNGVGDFEAAKRTVAAVKNGNSSAAAAQKKKSGVNEKALKVRKAVAAIGGKKKLVKSKSVIPKKTLFDREMNGSDDDDNVSDEDDSDGEDASEASDDEDEDSLELPDVNLLTTEEQLVKFRTLLRKRQVKEKMTLREHIRELEKKKGAMRGGKHVAEDLRREKRDLGKYIKQLEEEQKTKHAAALRDVEVRLAQLENSRRDPFIIAGEKAKAKNRLKLLGAAATGNGMYQSGFAEAFNDSLLKGVPAAAAANNRGGFGGRGFYDSEVVGADELQNMFAHLM